MTLLDALIVALALIGIPVGLWPREYPYTDSADATALGGSAPAENTNPLERENA